MTGKRDRSRARTRRVAWSLLVACLWLGFRPVARAADSPSVTATLSETITTVGEPVELRVTVTGTGALGRVQPPEVDGLTIRERDVSQSFQIRNFAVTEQHNYSYLVTPQRAGVFTLPETEIQVGVRKLRTPELTLSATSGSGAAGGRGNEVAEAQVRAELLLPKLTAYVGEALPAEFRLSFGSRVEFIEPGNMPLLLPGEGFTVGRWTRPQTTGARGLGGNGVGNQRLLYKTIITGARPGTLTLGPGETGVVVRVSRPRARANDRFSDDPIEGLFRQVFTPPRQVGVHADPVSLEVRPLPTADQPSDFTGGVGRFELGPVEVVSPARGTPVRAGEPVVVRMAVRGQGSFDRLGAPLPESTDGLRFYEPKDRFKPDDDVGLSGAKIFEQTFIPAGPRDTVPGFHLSYFDPVTGTYQGLRTPPLPLRILPGAVVAPTPAAPGSSVAAPPAPAPPPEEALRPLRPDPGFSARADALRPVFRQRGFWLMQLVPLAGLMALLTVLRVRARRRDVALQRRAARAREREALWRTVRDPHASRQRFLDAAVRLLTEAPADDPDAESIRARHAELAYGGGGDDAGEPAPAEERAEVLAVLGGKHGRAEAVSRPFLVRT